MKANKFLALLVVLVWFMSAYVDIGYQDGDFQSPYPPPETTTVSNPYPPPETTVTPNPYPPPPIYPTARPKPETTPLPTELQCASCSIKATSNAQPTQAPTQPPSEYRPTNAPTEAY